MTGASRDAKNAKNIFNVISSAYGDTHETREMYAAVASVCGPNSCEECAQFT